MIGQPTAFLQNIGTQELILIFLLALLLFGAKRLPELFKSFGKSIKEFKKATSGIEDDIRTAMETDEPQIEKTKHDFQNKDTQTDGLSPEKDLASKNQQTN